MFVHACVCWGHTHAMAHVCGGQTTTSDVCHRLSSHFETVSCSLLHTPSRPAHQLLGFSSLCLLSHLVSMEIIDVPFAVWLVCGFWGFELRVSYLHSKFFITEPSPEPAL